MIAKLELRRQLRSALRRTTGAEHLIIRAAIARTYWPELEPLRLLRQAEHTSDRLNPSDVDPRD